MTINSDPILMMLSLGGGHLIHILELGKFVLKALSQIDSMLLGKEEEWW